MRMLQSVFVFVCVFVIAGCGVGFNMSAEECVQKGRELAREGQRRKAYQYLLAATKKAPEIGEFHWTAAQMAQNPNAAYVHAEAAWSNGMKRPDVLMWVSRLRMHTEQKQRLEQALAMYDELPDSFQLPSFRAEILFQFGALDSALAIWQTQLRDSATPRLYRQIAMAQNGLGENEAAKKTLYDAQKKNLLREQGYMLLSSLHAFDYELGKADSVFSQARAYGYYTEAVELEHAAFLVAQGEFGRALPILKKLATPIPNKPMSTINHKARVYQGYAYAALKQKDNLKNLIVSLESTPVAQKEKLFYQALLQKIEGDTAYAAIAAARDSLPKQPVIELTYARTSGSIGKYKQAIEAYRSLPAAFLRAPRILTEFAVILARAGKEEEALAAVSAMHRKNLFTKPSLELYRDLTFKRDLLEKSQAAQQLLARKYPDDVMVQWKGAVLAIKAGKLDSAQAVLEKLANQHPESNQFEWARLSMYLAKKQYDKAIFACKASAAPAAITGPIMARAYRKLGKPKQAQAAYKKALAEKQSPSLMMQYADFLIAEGDNAGASRIYKKVITTGGEKLAADSAGNAIVLNNLAWSLIESGDDIKSGLEAAQKAYELMPENAHILDTYATGLIKGGKYKDAIKLLEGSALGKQEARLQFHLATAYEKSGSTALALRSYQAALKAMNAESRLDMPLSKSKLQAHIHKLEQQ